ncbi:MAG: hypothetical protein K0U24_01915 [Gammaproteobacteria bacterium]|nr:hypothetical protein [Gammaproteobacteria bacterium]
MPNEGNRPGPVRLPPLTRSRGFRASRVLPNGKDSTRTQLGIFQPTKNRTQLGSITEQDEELIAHNEQLEEQIDTQIYELLAPFDCILPPRDTHEVEVSTGRTGLCCTIS